MIFNLFIQNTMISIAKCSNRNVISQICIIIIFSEYPVCISCITIDSLMEILIFFFPEKLQSVKLRAFDIPKDSITLFVIFFF